jgi:hypothetical protein
VHVSGIERGADGKLIVEVRQDQTREVRLSVQVGSARVPPSAANIEIIATDTSTGQTASAQDHFIPANR